MTTSKEKVPNYWDYLKLADLLELQGGLEEDETQLETDELHFIITHQSLELWFKLILAELRAARNLLNSPTVPEKQVPRVVYHIRRVVAIMRLATQTFVGTLTPQDFMSFDVYLASGFQSFQMREIELILGIDWKSRVKYGSTDSLDHIRKLAKDSPVDLCAGKNCSCSKRQHYAMPYTNGCIEHHSRLCSQYRRRSRCCRHLLVDYLSSIQSHHTEQINNLIASSAVQNLKCARDLKGNSMEQNNTFTPRI